MSVEKISDNRVVTGSDGGRSAANVNYILYLVGIFLGLTWLIGVALAYSHRETASAVMRTHFDFQIKLFWRSIKFFVAELILYFVILALGVATLGIGFVLFVIPFAIWVWWLVSTLMRIIRGMKALGLGQPVGSSGYPAGGAATAVSTSAGAAGALPAPAASRPPEGWYDDPDRGGRKRWWDGAAWGIRDDEHPSALEAGGVAD